MKQEGAYNALHAVYRDTRQRQQWIYDFKKLGFNSTVRAQYDEISKELLAKPIGALYCLYQGVGVSVSEVDFAFFLDLATHLQVTKERLAGAAACLSADPKASTPAARRRRVAEAMIAELPCAQRADQRKRNLPFYDEMDLRQLFSCDESLARRDVVWSVRPSDCGLSDERTFPQPFEQPACAKPVPVACPACLSNCGPSDGSSCSQPCSKTPATPGATP